MPGRVCFRTSKALGTKDDSSPWERSKHIGVRGMYVREMVTSVVLGLLCVSTDQNTADMFTKPLPALSLVMHRDRLGVVKPGAAQLEAELHEEN
ncbi:hypothetical protein CYMTET_26416 [Cymbomonas tetramitiformis]|uniref:Uncharacterized protein n=1 Tax=Cymbomonas tetramitiformis TaxID=36881 RepID=A0AAE0KXY6_9CHLO|nr:hypothetical protein CYMTET_26416 [Cymbomonas tetramitiformis]